MHSHILDQDRFLCGTLLSDTDSSRFGVGHPATSKTSQCLLGLFDCLRAFIVKKELTLGLTLL